MNPQPAGFYPAGFLLSLFYMAYHMDLPMVFRRKGGRGNMRLDKYLKVSRIIKRRTVANEACSGGRVTLNGRVAKPGAEVRPGDVLTIRFGEHLGKYEILSVAETVRKDQAGSLFRVLEEDAAMESERNLS